MKIIILVEYLDDNSAISTHIYLSIDSMELWKNIISRYSPFKMMFVVYAGHPDGINLEIKHLSTDDAGENT
jgi:hypothetical protein